MIQTPGRKPYDPSVPRIVDVSFGKIKPRQPPSNYESIQKYINGNSGEIVEERLELYLSKLLERGHYKIKPEEIFGIVIGSKISYITKDNKWRSGGFLVSVHDSFTRYGENEEDIVIDENSVAKQYILYKAFNNAVFSLQLEDIVEFWIKNKSNRVRRAKAKEPNQKEIFKIPKKETKYPVYLLNDNGDHVVVYYARDNHVKYRFMNSMKFERASEEGWTFEDGTQGENFILQEEEIVLVSGDEFEEESVQEGFEDE